MRDTEEMITLGVRLRGTREEVEKAVSEFEHSRRIELLPWRPEGGWPVPLAKIMDERFVTRYAEQGRAVKQLRGIRGGDMVAHVHLGDDVYLLDQATFSEMVSEVASKLSAELAQKVDYEKTVDLMSQFAIETIPLPE